MSPSEVSIWCFWGVCMHDMSILECFEICFLSFEGALKLGLWEEMVGWVGGFGVKGGS